MPEYLTAREYADRFKLDEETVRRYIRKGLLLSIRLGDGSPRSPIRIVVERDQKGREES